ncbi:MAG: CHAT domain-containing protein [Cyanobacteria bacterium J06623_7]
MNVEQLVQEALQAIAAGSFALAEKKLLNALSITRSQGAKEIEVKVLHQLINVDLQQGNYGATESRANLALEIARKISDRTLIYQSWFNLGLSLYWQEEYDRSILAYKAALEYIAEDNSDCWQIWHGLGETYFWQENYSEAIKAHDRAFALASNNTRQSTSQFNLGQVYYWMGNYSQAITCLKASLKLDTVSPHRISVLNTLGQIYTFTKQWEEAEQVLEDSLVLARAANSRDIILVTLNLLIPAKLELNRGEIAENLAQEAVMLAESTQKEDVIVSCLINLGLAQSQLAKFEAAIATYSRGEEIVRRLGDRGQTIVILLSLSGIYELQGKYTAAIACCVETLAIAETAGDLSTVQLVLKNLGQIYLSLGNYRTAIAYIEKYLAVAQNDGDPTTDIDAYQMLGNACRSCGEYDRALESFQSALSLATEIDNIDERVRALTNLATVCRSKLQYPAAGDYLNRALALADKIGNLTIKCDFLFEGISLLTLEGNPQAIVLCHELLKLSQQTSAYPEHLVWQTLADVYSRMGEHDKAIAELLKANAVIQSQTDELLKGENLNALGKAYLQANRYPEAETELTQAIAVWENLRQQLGNSNLRNSNLSSSNLDNSNLDSGDQLKISFLTKQRITYQLLLQALVAQHKFDAALEKSELGRARSLAEILNENNPHPSANSTAEITIEQIKQLAQTLNVTLVEYAETLTALYIWVITPNGAIHFHQESLVNPWAVMTDAASGVYPGSELNQAVETLRRAMNISQSLLRKFIAIDEPEIKESPSNRQNWQSALQTIYQFTIEPIKQYLPQDPLAKIIFIPQGYLFNVPFPALMDASGAYLIENHTIATAPSIQILQLTSENKQLSDNSLKNPADSVLIVGNPVMPDLSATMGYKLSPLPGAEQEARAIAKIFAVSPTIGAEASKNNIIARMSTAKIIHLATHGLLDYAVAQNPLENNIPGAIALAPDKESTEPDNGLLTASEITTMTLQANLAVLSACHTGRGEITADGVIGLSRTLSIAGVSNVLVSLWAIPDAPTAALMANFYRQINQGTDKAQSLRQAMLQAIADQEHPNSIYWAAFTLIGD